jgi:hypothetical protein
MSLVHGILPRAMIRTNVVEEVKIVERVKITAPSR